MSFKFLLKSMPANLRRAVSGYVWTENKIGLSSAKVFRLESENKSSLYLKVNSRASQHSLTNEKEKLEWLKNRLPVPEVLLFETDETNEYLLLSEISGVDASDNSLQKQKAETIETLTDGLRMIHELPADDCPFVVTLGKKIGLARENMSSGSVDAADFDRERKGKTAEELFEEMLDSKPAAEDLVFTHGDYCVPNVILKNGRLSGFVDWESCGIADRYQDIALLTRSVKYNFGEEWESRVFEIYGIEPDWEKIYFYRLLDEFF